MVESKTSAEKFNLLTQRIVRALKENKPFKEEITPGEFKMLLLGGIQAYSAEIEKSMGVRLTLMPDNIQITILDGWMNVSAKGLAEKKFAKKVMGKEFVVWTPPVGFELKTRICNSVEKSNRFSVRKVDFSPTSLLGFDVAGKVVPRVIGWGLYEQVRAGFVGSMKKNNVQVDGLWLRITKGNKIYLGVTGKPITTRQ